MSCVNRSSREFKALAANNNVDTNTLELIIHKYWIETGSEEKYPTDVYIQAQLGNDEYQENIPQVRQLWQRDYSYPKEYSSLQEVQKAVEEAQKFFPKSAIVYYKDAKGSFILTVKRPVEEVSYDTAEDFFSQDFSSAKTLDLGLKENEEYTIDKVEELFNKLNNDRTSKYLAEKVFRIAKDLGLQVSFSNDIPFGMTGRYTNNNTITYRKSFLERDANTGKKAPLLLHEVIHALTVYAVSDDRMDVKKNKSLRKFQTDINRIFNEIRFNKALEGERGIKSVREFVAELANPIFRQKLQSIDANRKRSVWNRIVDAIKSFLGIHPSSTYYQRSMNALDKALNAFDIDAYLAYNGMKSPLQQAYNEHRIDFENMSEEELKSLLKDAIKEQKSTLNNKKVNDNGESNFKQGLQRGGELLGEALRLLKEKGRRDDKEDAGKSNESKSLRARIHEEAARQHQELIAWAKKNNELIVEPDDYFDELFEDSNLRGSESKVWVNPDHNTVIKSIKPSHYATPQALLERIAIHNILFPSTAMTVQGFSTSDNGISVIVEQPYAEASDGIASFEEIESYMASQGFIHSKGKGVNSEYTKDGYLVSDIRPENVIKQPNGELAVIDCFAKIDENAETNPTVDGLSSLIDNMSREQIVGELKKIRQEYSDYDLINDDSEEAQQRRKKNTFTFSDGTTGTAETEYANQNTKSEEQRIKETIKDFINGTKQFNNLTQEENDTARRDRLLAGGEVASRLYDRTNGEESQDERNERQEKQVEQWSKDNKVWHDNAIAYGKSFGEEYSGGGQKSRIFVSEDNKRVIKVKNTTQYHDLQEFLDGIVLHNTLFPETAYKVLGFGNDNEGFVAILEQPFVRGTEPTQEQITEFVKSRVPDAEIYEEGLGNGRYKTSQTLLHDLSPRNAIITPNGNIAIIDDIIRPNIASEGKGGQRSDNYSIVDTSTHKVSLPGYEYFMETYEDTTVDAAWKIPQLQELDAQLSNDNTPEQNQEIINKMNGILKATVEEDIKEISSKKQEEINKQLDDYDKINTQIDNLLEGHFDKNKVFSQGEETNLEDFEIKFSATEVRKVAEFIGNDITDIITKIQTEDGYAEKTFQDISLPKNANYSAMTRLEVVNAVGLENILEQARKDFDPATFEYSDTDTDLKATLAMENWDALMLLAGDTFSFNEGFGIRRNYDKQRFEITQGDNLQIDVDDPNEYQDEMAREEEGDGQEGWQVDQRTVDTMWSMSQLVRQVIHECYETDKNGNKIIDEGWQKPLRIEPRKAVNIILNWCRGSIDLHDMIDRLSKKQAKHPWVSQLLKRLTDDTGREADFQSQFFGVFCKAFQPYNIILLKNGKYISVPCNDHPARRQAFDNIVAQYKIGVHPLFTTDGKIKADVLGEADSKSDTFTLHKAYDFLNPIGNSAQKHLEGRFVYRNFTISPEQMREIAANINGVYRLLGFVTTEEQVLSALDEPAIVEVTNALWYIIKDLDAALKDQKRNIGNYKAPKYQPFAYGKDHNIEHAVRKIIAPVTDVLEDTAINAFYDSGKMYQSYVVPSFLTKWSNKIKTLEGQDFRDFLMSEYGDSEWFRDSKTGEWRNPMLSELTRYGSNKEFDFRVELNFNKHNYMRNMSDSEYTLSLLSEYFSVKSNVKGRSDFGYFRIPMESNKPSSEFFRWYAYKDEGMYKDQVTNDLFKFYLQEISRIQTVRMRNKKKGDEGFIKNFDTHGRKFNFLPFLNAYLENDAASKRDRTLLRNEDNTVSEDNDRMAELLQRHIDGLEEHKLSTEELASLEQMVKKSIRNYMQDRADKILDSWDKAGIIEAARKISNIVTDDVFLNEDEKDPVERNKYVRKSVENFIWNDFLAANNILELTVGDIAFYDSAEDLQKRLSELHAPGIRANIFATDYDGNRVSDGKYRTGLLKDFNKYKSNITANISEVCDRIINRAPDSQKPALRAWKESLVGKDGHYTKINVADAQGLSAPSSYRKKALMFGKWSRHAEEIYQKLLKGEYNYDDLQTVFQTLKPFVYTHLTKNLGVADAPIHTMHVPFQAKNSEYLLIMADAMIQGEISKSGELGRPNLLRAIYDIMEDSAYDGRERDAAGKVTKIGTYNGKGIDTFQFESAIKSGLQGALDLGQFAEMQGGRAAAYEYLKEKLYNADGTYNTDNYVHEASFEDYCIQQEVPDHFKEHEQAEGSQIRMIIPSDLDYYKNPTLSDAERDNENNIVYYEWDEPDGAHRKVNAKEFREEYEETIGENIEDSLNQLSTELHLNSNDKRERNIALSSILQREILSSPRYGVDLLQACSVDKKTGEFRIPKGDPIQSKRIEQLINSIIKNRVNKQKIAGGPVVQVTNFGTSRQLHIRFNDRRGGILKMEDEFYKDDALVSQYKTYKNYTKERQAGIAYFEVFAPIWDKKLVEDFADENGNIDIDALENASPELLRMVSYRIPTEDKYSTAPMKVVGFLPREAGSAIMLPYELTEIDDSDFDVDKRYIMRKDLPLRMKRKNDAAKAIEDIVFENFKKAHNDKISSEQKQHYRGMIDLYLTDKLAGNYSKDNRYQWNDSNITPFVGYLDRIFRKVGWETIKPEKGSREYRNNKIIDMSLAVLTNEFTADKILNPGGFDNFKKTGYMIEAYRKHPEMSWESLQKMSIDKLKALSDTDKHLGWVDTEIQFYNQNSATTSMIGIYAVNKIAHAVLESNGIQISVSEICDNPFTIDGHQFGYGDGLMEIDPRYDMEGNLIGKTLGSGVSASADGVKAPVQNLMNINTTTAGTFNTMLRLGLPFEDASLLISQDVITRVLKDFNQRKLSNWVSLDDVIQDHIDAIAKDKEITENASIKTQELTKQQMIDGLTPTEHTATDYKALLAFQKFMQLSEQMRKPTFATRFNSISSAVGPLIIDNLIMEHKMEDFGYGVQTNSEENSTHFYDKEGNMVDIEDILGEHPILYQFSRTVDVAGQIFKDMPAGSEGFRNVLRKIPQGLKTKIYGDKQILSKLSDFYQSYLLLSSGLIKEGDLGYYVNEFPKWFDKQGFKQKYPDNPFIQAINLKVSNKTNRPFLEIRITGMDQSQKDVLSSGWIDLHKENPELSTKLFIYNFFRAGIGFSPKTFMALVPTYVKEHLEGKDGKGNKVTYIGTYRNFPTTNSDVVFDQFVRNNWDNSKLVPWRGGKDSKFSVDYKNGTLTVTNPSEIKKMSGDAYIKTKYFNQTYLWKQVNATRNMIEYRRVTPLGDNNEYLEMYLEGRNKGLSDTTTLTDDNAPDSPSNNGTDMMGQKSQDEPTGAGTSSGQDGHNMSELVDLMTKQIKQATGRTMTKTEAFKKIEYTRDHLETMGKFLGNVFKHKGLNLNEKEAKEEFKKYC